MSPVFLITTMILYNTNANRPYTNDLYANAHTYKDHIDYKLT